MSIISMYLVFAMLAVIWLDVTRFTIPNWLVGSLLILYPIAVWLAPIKIEWLMAIAAMLMLFAIGYFLFSMKWMGGGDVKLLSVIALWIGLSRDLPTFMFMVSIVGGLFTAALIVARKWAPAYIKNAEKPLPRILQIGAPVPYGVAIALVFIWWVMTNQIRVLALH
jgi:prepilin peptidase CpaA